MLAIVSTGTRNNAEDSKLGDDMRVSPYCSSEAAWTVPLEGIVYGRARLALRFCDNSSLAVHYFVLPPLRAHVAKFGAFLADVAWLGDDEHDGTDPFGRSRSVMPWDRQSHRHVLQDPRWAHLKYLISPFATGTDILPISTCSLLTVAAVISCSP